jgi:hypothetical protein
LSLLDWTDCRREAMEPNPADGVRVPAGQYAPNEDPRARRGKEETGAHGSFQGKGKTQILGPPERTEGTENRSCEKTRAASHLQMLKLRVHIFNRQE